MRMVAAKLPSDFSGLGVVFYRSLHALPHTPLTLPREEAPSLPVDGAAEVALSLARAGSKSSSHHDGFHFVHLVSLRLTHLSQYVSPPIPQRLASVPVGGGARHMTAILASQVEGITSVGLLTQRGQIALYEGGELIMNEQIA